MHARITTLTATEEQHREDVRIVRDEYLPWVRDSSGFRGILGFYDASTGRSIVVTLWEDEESLNASAEAADRLSRLSTGISGARREDVSTYVVDYFDVDGRDFG